ncbi:hypothetical protein [Streptomyces sp. NPDC001980]|uniref:hypothetical protein n=1 Tax=Streptomyces sp. NPDC001980 TaxID=3157126 RepID=UPI003318320F
MGLAIARRFAAEGSTVHLTGRNRTELDTAVETLGTGPSASKAMSRISSSDEARSRVPCSPFTSLGSGSRRRA